MPAFRMVVAGLLFGAVLSAPHGDPQGRHARSVGTCKSWCQTDSRGWDGVCNFQKCAGCAQCITESPTEAPTLQLPVFNEDQDTKDFSCSWVAVENSGIANEFEYASTAALWADEAYNHSLTDEWVYSDNGTVPAPFSRGNVEAAGGGISLGAAATNDDSDASISDDCPCGSAGLTTSMVASTGTAKFGYIETKLTVDPDSGLQSTVFLQGLSGEIDLIEVNADGTTSTNNYRCWADDTLEDGTEGSDTYVDLADGEEHTVGVYWTAESATFYIDGDQYRTVEPTTAGCFDQEMNMVVSIELQKSKPVPDLGGTTPKTVIDYVRHWAEANCGGCKPWCDKNNPNWANRCQNHAKCGGCSQCDTEAPTAAPVAPPTAAPTVDISGKICDRWCKNQKAIWYIKCGQGRFKNQFKRCEGCNACASPYMMEPKICKSWCYTDPNLWKFKCRWLNCGKCDACDLKGSPRQLENKFTADGVWTGTTNTYVLTGPNSWSEDAAQAHDDYAEKWEDRSDFGVKP